MTIKRRIPKAKQDARTFPGPDHLKPEFTPDTEKATNILYDALESGATPDVALVQLSQHGLDLEQANAFRLLVSVQKFRQQQADAKRLTDILKDMPKDLTEITETPLGFVHCLKPVEEGK